MQRCLRQLSPPFYFLVRTGRREHVALEGGALCVCERTLTPFCTSETMSMLF